MAANGNRAGTGPGGHEASRLRKQLNIMALEVGLYREIGGLVVTGRPMGYILGRIMDYALKAMGADSGTLYLLDRKTNELSFEVVKGPSSGRLKGLRLKADAGIAGKVASTGKPHISTDLRNDNAWAGLKISDKAGARNMIAVPLAIKKKVAGVIEIMDKAGGPFTEDDLRALTSLSNHFSIILERAGLVAELDGKLSQLAILNEVGSLLNSTLDQTTVRHRAMEAITRLMGAETGSLLLVDDSRNELYFEVALGSRGRRVKEIRLRVGEGIAGWVAKHGKPLMIPDASKDERFSAKADEKSRFTTRDMICVPVKTKDKVIGVLQAINKVGGSFTKDDLGLFLMFSNQVAIALDNARLYEEIRETFYATSGALVEAIEKRDPYTGGHTKRVLEYSLATGRQLGLEQKELEALRLSALLHDIGKIGIEDSILRKQAPLDMEEAAMMRRHPELGAEILGHVPQLKDIIPGMLCHHERVDGNGYPKGFKKRKIPLAARIISVADAFDAMTTTRPYRKGLPIQTALGEIRKHSGVQFDPEVVNAFLKAYRNGDIRTAG